MKRVFVPTALHAELTEYTNLVRVLRTTHTLNLTSQLIHHAAQHRKNEVDTWTSWPLIDCPVPEWSLEDEIHHLGETVARRQMQAVREVDDRDDLGSDSDSDSELLSPPATKRLVLHTGAVLVHILNLLAYQRPSTPGSMQNRLWPMNWEDIISLLAVSGVVDPIIVARAEKRLERIYGPSTTKAMVRVESTMPTKARCALLAAAAEDQLCAPPVLSRPRRNDGKGRVYPLHRQTHHQHGRRPNIGLRSNKRGVKSRAVVDTDTNMEA